MFDFLAFCEYFKLPAGVKIPYFGGLLYRTLSMIENRYIRTVALPETPLNLQARPNKIIASLTTFPARVEEVIYTIKSLMLQSYKPDRIWLWLAEEQFPQHRLPQSLVNMQDKGLEIRFCPDYKSHKKYFFALQEQRDDELVITFDDDIIYHPETIERAVKKHAEFPSAIVCNQCHRIQVDIETGEILPYRRWSSSGRENRMPTFRTQALTGSGCLYPPKVMPAETFDWELIQKLALTADDLWMKIMSIHNDVKVVRTDKAAKTFTIVTASQTEHLAAINLLQGGNDKAMTAMLKAYPDVQKKLLTEI